MITFDLKTSNVHTDPAFPRAIHKMNVTSLRHAAGLISRVAKNSIKTMPRGVYAPEGHQPFTHPSFGKRGVNGALRNSIRYEEEKSKELAVVGVGFSGLLDIGYAHEIGGWFRFYRWKKPRFFPKRPFMLPALVKVAPSLPKLWAGRLVN